MSYHRCKACRSVVEARPTDPCPDCGEPLGDGPCLAAEKPSRAQLQAATDNRVSGLAGRVLGIALLLGAGLLLPVREQSEMLVLSCILILASGILTATFFIHLLRRVRRPKYDHFGHVIIVGLLGLASVVGTAILVFFACTYKIIQTIP